MKCKVFVEHVNIEKEGAKLVRHDFNSLRSALAYIKGSDAIKVGNTVEATHDRGKDKITTYKGSNGNYFLTRRYKK